MPSPGLDPVDLSRHIVWPVLEALAAVVPAIACPAALELVMATAAHESQLCKLDQFTGKGDAELGPACGLFQMEPRTARDIHQSFLHFRSDLAEAVNGLMIPKLALGRGLDPDPIARQLAGNLYYAAAMCRLHYYRSPVKLAEVGDVAGHAKVWKLVYNTSAGKGTEADFIANYRRLIEPVRDRL